MKTKRYIYWLGTFILFLGLLWMFLPHTTHHLILNEHEESSHLFHTMEGGFIAVIGIMVMVFSSK